MIHYDSIFVNSDFWNLIGFYVNLWTFFYSNIFGGNCDRSIWLLQETYIFDKEYQII